MKLLHRGLIALFIIYCCLSTKSLFAQLNDPGSYLTQRIALIKKAPDKRPFLLNFIKDMQSQILLFKRTEQERTAILHKMQLDHEALLLSVFGVGEPLANSTIEKNTRKAYTVSIQTLYGGEFPERQERKFKKYTAAVIEGLKM